MRLFDAGCILFGLWLPRRLLEEDLQGSRWPYALVAIGLYMLLAMHWPLYRSWRSASMRIELALIAQCWITTAALLGAGLYLGDSQDIPRTLGTAWMVLTLALLLGSRIILRLSLRAWRMLGRNHRTAAILGATQVGETIARQIERNAWMGMKLAGFFDDRLPCEGRTAPQVQLKGTTDELMSAIHRGEIDVVYLALPLRAELRVRDFMARLRDSTVTVLYAPDLSAFGLLRARWEELGGVPVLSLVDTPHVGLDGVAKRVFDVVASGLLLLLLALPLLAVAAAVRLESPGPVIFRQRRYGLDGREFVIYKFRSMCVTEDGRDTFGQVERDDPRVTRFGSFLRRNSIDELPQLINVLQGRMSMVGPRPHPVALNETHRRLIDGYMLRHKVKPGITGWAQVHGYRGETDTLEKMSGRIHYDLEYIENWSLGMDARILFKTFFRVFDDPSAF